MLCKHKVLHLIDIQKRHEIIPKRNSTSVVPKGIPLNYLPGIAGGTGAGEHKNRDATGFYKTYFRKLDH